MKEISVKGENYVKASVIAKKYGYTSDYIGQLCRNKQLKATLVGRSWYVNEDSVIEHKKGRYRSNITKSTEDIRKKTEGRKTYFSASDPRYLNRLVRYDVDESELLPVLPEKSPKETEDTKNQLDTTANNTATNIPISAKSTPIISSGRVLPKEVNNSSRAVFRTIPALNNRAVAPTGLKETRPVKPKRSRVVLAAIAMLFMTLSVEALIVTAMLGLEKKLITTPDGSVVVLYNFVPTHVVHSAAVIFAKN